MGSADVTSHLQLPSAAMLPSKPSTRDTRKSTQKKTPNQTKTIKKKTQTNYSSEHRNWPSPWCARQSIAYLLLLQHFNTQVSISSLFGTSHLNPCYHGLPAAMQSPDLLSVFSIFLPHSSLPGITHSQYHVCNRRQANPH